MKDGQHGARCDSPWSDLYTTERSAEKAARDLTNDNVSIVHEVKQCTVCNMWYILASGQK
jgi:hypothetical protein